MVILRLSSSLGVQTPSWCPNCLCNCRPYLSSRTEQPKTSICSNVSSRFQTHQVGPQPVFPSYCQEVSATALNNQWAFTPQRCHQCWRDHHPDSPICVHIQGTQLSDPGPPPMTRHLWASFEERRGPTPTAIDQLRRTAEVTGENGGPHSTPCYYSRRVSIISLNYHIPVPTTKS